MGKFSQEVLGMVEVPVEMEPFFLKVAVAVVEVTEVVVAVVSEVLPEVVAVEAVVISMLLIF